MTREQLKMKRAEHEDQLVRAKVKLSEARAAATGLSQLVLRIEGAVLAISALIEQAPADAPTTCE